MIGRRTRVADRKVVLRGRDCYREIVQSLETESKLGNFVHHLDWNNATPQCIIRELHGLRYTGKPNFPSLDSILYCVITHSNVVTQHSINNPPVYESTIRLMIFLIPLISRFHVEFRNVNHSVFYLFFFFFEIYRFDRSKLKV